MVCCVLIESAAVLRIKRYPAITDGNTNDKYHQTPLDPQQRWVSHLHGNVHRVADYYVGASVKYVRISNHQK